MSRDMQRQMAFENTLQEYFEQTNFDPRQVTPKTDLSFNKNGLYYSIKCIWFKDGYIEARVIAYPTNPSIPYEDKIFQKCSVHYQSPHITPHITPSFAVMQYIAEIL